GLPSETLNQKAARAGIPFMGPDPNTDGSYFHQACCIDVRRTRYPVFIVFSLWESNMPNSDAFALPVSGLNDFLFAPVGTEANGMTLSVVSVFARSGNDPWVEAGRLARLPKLEATESLGRIIASMPTSIWPVQAATAIAARLVALLPTSSAEPMQSLLAPGIRARLGRFL